MECRGLPQCRNPSLVRLTHTESRAYAQGERVFEGDTNVVKFAVT